jgi:hypothetical protein
VNLLEAKKKALSLMAEYSVDGVVISDSENADYLMRMNRFANDAQMEISEKIKIEESFTINQEADNSGGYNKYDLPDDLKEHRFIFYNDDTFSDYRIMNKRVYIDKAYDGEFEVFYYKNPSEIDDTTSDSYVFEVPSQTHALIPYFIGAMALQDENPNLSANLLNLYYRRLESLQDNSSTVPTSINTVYWG